MKPSRADSQTWTNNIFFHQDNAIATTVSTREKRKQNVGFKVFKGNLTTFIIADTTEEKKLLLANALADKKQFLNLDAKIENKIN